jgi:hypothetical protein
MEDREIEVPRQVYETVTRTVQRPKTVMEEKVRGGLFLRGEGGRVRDRGGERGRKAVVTGSEQLVRHVRAGKNGILAGGHEW